MMQAPNKIPADIVFIIRDKPHPHFKYDLIILIKMKMTLVSMIRMVIKWMTMTMKKVMMTVIMIMMKAMTTMMMFQFDSLPGERALT